MPKMAAADEVTVNVNLEAEQALLGAMLLEGVVADDVIEKTTARVFYMESHRTLFNTIRDLRARGAAVDLVTLTEHMTKMNTIEAIGGASYISALANRVPTAKNYEHYLKILIEKAALRDIADSAAIIRTHTNAGNLEAAVEAMKQGLEETAVALEGRRLRPILISLADVEPQQTRWLWKPYIPLDCITILEGDPKTGKTWLALAITAAITRGWPLPGETAETVARQPANVLYMTGEDSLAMTLRPRLEKAGADLSRVRVIEGIQLPNGKTKLDVSMQDIDQLSQALDEVKPAMMIVDPLAAFLGPKVNSSKFEEVRPVLKGIAKLTEDYGCSCLLIRHLSKGSKDRAIYRGQGSIDFTAAARSVLMVGRDPHKPETRTMAHSVCNLAKEGPSQAFAITDEGKFEWAGETETTAAELAAPEFVDLEEKGARAEAKEWLKAALAGGARPAREMEDEATAMSIATATLKRARKELNIQASRKGNAWYWELPKTKTDHREGVQGYQETLM